MTNYKQLLAERLAPLLPGLETSAVADLIEYPPNPEMGDLSLPCFKLSKAMPQWSDRNGLTLKSVLFVSLIFRYNSY